MCWDVGWDKVFAVHQPTRDKEKKWEHGRRWFQLSNPKVLKTGFLLKDGLMKPTLTNLRFDQNSWIAKSKAEFQPYFSEIVLEEAYL